MKHLHILSQETDRKIRDALKTKLTDEGFRVTDSLLTGKGDIQGVKALAPDLVLLCFSEPPGVDARQVATRLWQLFAIPVIFILGRSEGLRHLRETISILPFGVLKGTESGAELSYAIELAFYWAAQAQANYELKQRLRFEQPDGGGEITAELRASSLPEGGVSGLNAGLMLSKQKQSYLKLLSRAVEQSPASVVITDIDGNIEYVNTQFTRVTGYTSEEVLGKNPSLLASGKTSSRTYQELWGRILAGECWSGTLHNRRKDGRLYQERAVIQGITDEQGKVTHLLAVKEDITEKREAELREQKKTLLLSERTEQLVSSEFRWKYALEGAGDGVWDWSVETGRTYFSKRWKTMLGYAEDEIANNYSAWESCIHPEDKARVMAALNDYFEGRKQEYGVSHRLRCKDGRYKWILARGIAVSRDKQNKPQRMIGTHTDMTRHREREQRIRDSESQLLAIFENSQVGIMLLKGRHTLANGNQRLAGILGYDNPQQMRGIDMCQLYLSEAHFHEFQQHHYERLASEETVRVEYQLKRRNGEPVWCQLSGKALDIHLPKDLAKGVIWVIDDISQRKQAELELRQANRALREERELFTGGPVMVFRWLPSAGWPVEFCTGNVFLELGYRAQDFTQEAIKFAELIHPQDLPRITDEVTRFLAAGRSDFEQEYRLRRADGEYRVFYDFTRVIRDTGGRVSLLHGYLLDITSQKQHEQERHRIERELQHGRKMEAMGQLTGGVAHEFNNMLAVILGHTALMRTRLEQLGEQKVLEYLQHIESAGGQSKALVRQMLSFSRSEESRAIRSQLKPLVQEIITLARATLPSSIEIEYQAESGLPEIQIDPGELQQVMMNLFVNARDAMQEKGCLKVTLGLLSGLREECHSCHSKLQGRWLELGVEDDGCGIAREDIERVFEPFFTTKPVGKGTGLGLSVVQGLIERQGGHVMIESRLGEGSRFRLLFPPAEVRESVGETSLERPPEPAVNQLSGLVLVVDDEPGMLALLREILEQKGLQVEGVNDSRLAVERLCQTGRHYDLLITDQTMPGMVGTELCKTAREICPNMPLILCTGHSESVDAENAAQFGIDYYLEKPLEIRRLQAVVESIFTA